MKKIKMMLVALFVCALGYGSYSAYDYATMTDAERFLLANIEALTQYEPGGETGLSGDCNKSIIYVTECQFVCGCGRVWRPSPRVENAVAANITGRCIGCGTYPR